MTAIEFRALSLSLMPLLLLLSVCVTPSLAQALPPEGARNRLNNPGADQSLAGWRASEAVSVDQCGVPNTINFDARGDLFIENNGESEFDHGGLIVLGVENISPATGGGSRNTVNVTLRGCHLLRNDVADLLAIGARSVPETTAAQSQDNRVTITIRAGRGRSRPVEVFADSVPASPSWGNSVTVVRH